MLHRLTLAVLGAASLTLVAAGCASWDPDNQARDRAIAVLDCTEVTVEKVADLHYRAAGCGGRVDVLCSAGHLEPVCLAVRPRDEARVSGLAEQGAGGEVAVDDEGESAGDDAVGVAADVGMADPASGVERQIRRGLDARRDDVLACTGRSATVVRVRYQPDGRVTVSLAGDLEGGPEEGCVRAAIGGVRVEPGHEGVVMHLLRR
ncbi:MAG: hypothetical protein OHK0013_30110 [Sandaracinaceae bacterium]